MQGVHEVGYSANIPALDDLFGFQFTRLPEYLRKYGWADEDGMASVTGRVKAVQ